MAAERINGTWVGDSQTPMFDDPPKCWLHKQAAWIPDFWPEGKEPGVDSRFFYFPAIDEAYGNPVLGGSDMFVMFNDRPEVRALLQWFSTPESVQSRVQAGGFLARTTPSRPSGTRPTHGPASPRSHGPRPSPARTRPTHAAARDAEGASTRA